MSAIQHMALGVFGFGCEDALVHLMNYVWPNVFETSPHVVQAFMGAIEGMRVGVGPSKVLQYALQVSVRVVSKISRLDPENSKDLPFSWPAFAVWHERTDSIKPSLHFSFLYFGFVALEGSIFSQNFSSQDKNIECFSYSKFTGS